MTTTDCCPASCWESSNWHPLYSAVNAFIVQERKGWDGCRTGAGKLILAVVCCPGGVGRGLRYKVIAPNLDTSNTCCPFFPFIFSSAVAGRNDCQQVLENETIAEAFAGIFTSVTGDTELLLIKNPRGGRTTHSISFMITWAFLSDAEETVYCVTNPFSVISKCQCSHFALCSEPKWLHEQWNHGRSWLKPPYTLYLPLPRSITCKDLVFRAHYFLLSSHTLSKAMVGLLRLESQGLWSGKQGIQWSLG